MLQMMRMKRNRAGDTVQTVTSAHKFSFHYTQQRRLMRPQTQLKAQPCVDGKSLILKIFLQKPHMPGFLEHCWSNPAFGHAPSSPSSEQSPIPWS
ncbi:hypothetical protein GN956_G26020 [Arapaima gigas]